MSLRTCRIILKGEPEGGYAVIVPALPGCITYGEDLDAARAMAKEAIELYVEELKSRNQEVPDDSDTLNYSLHLETA